MGSKVVPVMPNHAIRIKMTQPFTKLPIPCRAPVKQRVQCQQQQQQQKWSPVRAHLHLLGACRTPKPHTHPQPLAACKHHQLLCTREGVIAATVQLSKLLSPPPCSIRKAPSNLNCRSCSAHLPAEGKHDLLYSASCFTAVQLSLH
jgi:hypothetical protein